MSVRTSVFGMAALSLAAVGFVATPDIARAQDPPPAGGAGESNDQSKIISLDLESTDLYAALTLLFKQAKTNYTLDPNLRGNLVTVHVKLPFKQALETVLKASGLPYTYSFENNVYSVVPIKVEVPDVLPPSDPNGGIVPVEPDELSAQVTKLFLGTSIVRTNGLDIASMLGAKNFILYTGSYDKGSVGYNPFAGQNGGGGAGGGIGGGGGGFGGGGFAAAAAAALVAAVSAAAAAAALVAAASAAAAAAALVACKRLQFFCSPSSPGFSGRRGRLRFEASLASLRRAVSMRASFHHPYPPHWQRPEKNFGVKRQMRSSPRH